MKHRAGESKTLGSLDHPIPGDPARRASGVQARAERAPSAPPATEQATLPLISIGSPADPALLEPTYAYISTYAFACWPPQVAQRLNVAVYELYANALHYGSTAGEVRLEIRRTGSGGAELRVSNHTEPARLERLKAHVRRVQADPSAAFSGEMNRFAGASQPPPMLGIVRVAHESALRLELVVDGDRVEISTTCEG